MNRILFFMLFALAACAPSKQETATDTTETVSAATSAAETSASAPATKADEATSATSEGAAASKKGTKMDYDNKIAEIHTTAGEIDIRFFPKAAPNHVKNFVDLASSGFYNGTKFHRVIPGFMIQGGDPNTKQGDVNTWGMGGNGSNRIRAEFNDISHKRGIVSMARSQDPNSASSQFFICVADSKFLDRQYSVFGEVVKGMDVADKIVSAPRDTSNDRPKNPVAIESIKIRDAKPGEIPAAK